MVITSNIPKILIIFVENKTAIYRAANGTFSALFSIKICHSPLIVKKISTFRP